MKGKSVTNKSGSTSPEIVPGQPETSITDLIEKAVPLVKAWQEGEVKKVIANSEIEKHYVITEYRFKRFLIIVLGIGMGLVLGLCTYLFFTNKDVIAGNILTITITGVISFIGGFGLGKSSSGSGENL